MPTLNISTEQAQTDAQRYREALERALHALANARQVRIGATPRERVYSEDKIALYRYRGPNGVDSSGPAILIVYALINRPSMMDLQEDRSLIRGLLDQGLDVFLIEWGSPDGSDRYLELHDYLNRYVDHCVREVLRIRNESQVNLVGVCQGGTLALCYTALHPAKVRNLITMVTPIDFHTPDDLISKWVRHVDVDTLVDKFGNVSGEALNGVFLSLLPFRLTSQKYVNFLDVAHDPAQVENFLRMEQWIFDSPDNPGEMFRQFSNWFYKENRLKQGTLEVNGRKVDLKRIAMPVLNVYATQDHIVPPASSTCLGELVATDDYTTHAVPSGHIGIYVSSKSKELPGRIAEWLRARDKESRR